MKGWKYIFLFSPIIFAICCKKDVAVERAEKTSLPGYTSGIYYPAFPGTWWDYRKPDSSLVRFEMLPDFHDYHGRSLPYHKNMNLFIDESNFLVTRFGTEERFSSPIYSQKKDSLMACPISFSNRAIYFSNSPIRRVAISTDTSISVFNIYFQHVIVMKETSILDSNHRYLDYFAKDVGLIRRDSFNENNPKILIPLLRIENFHIGN